MSSSVLRRRGGARRSEVVGFSGTRARVLDEADPSSGATEGDWTEVHIQWKQVMNKLVTVSGGSNPIFTTEHARYPMFQQRVSFIIPMVHSGAEYDDVSVTGDMCSSLYKAESKVAAAALQRFACGMYNTKLMDISQVRYEELKISSKEILLKTGELYLAADMTLSNWLQCTQQIDDTHEVLFPRTANCAHIEDSSTVRRIKIKVGNQLRSISTLNHERYDMLINRLEAGKTHLRNTCASTERYFKEYLIPRDEKYRGELPHEVKIRMKIVLFEMMISLGWDEPEYTLLWRVNGMYACAVEIQPPGVDSERILVEGEDELCEEEAAESVAKLAILQLEKQMSVYLVDLNYNKRSRAEENLAKAKSALDVISHIIQDAFREWEDEVETLSICDDFCKGMMERHVVGEFCVEEYNIKWKYAESIAELQKACQFALKFGRRRHRQFSTWMDRQ